MKMPLGKVMTFGMLGWASLGHAAVWTTTNQWSPDAEKSYQAWALTAIAKNTFVRPGPLQGVVLDCADSVYSMRMYYSFLSGLPFVIHDPTGSGTITNDMTRFDRIADPSERFRAFAEWIYGVAGTSSLPRDSYPVAVTRDAVHGGVFVRSDPANHHSWSIQQVDNTGIPHLFFASRPARTTLFERDYIPSMDFMFPHGNTLASEAGFRMWRHPEDILKPEWEVPGYSTDQFEIPIGKWIRTVQKRLQLVNESPEQRTIRALGNACAEARDRVGVIAEGVAFLATMGDRVCMTPEEFDDYSTPSKDARTKAAFQELADAYVAAGNGVDLSPAVKAEADSVVAGEGSAPSHAEPNGRVKISATDSLTLGQVFDRSLHDKLSSNPLDPFEIRWGDAPGPSARAAGCPSY
jgi:hypothetical protein